MTPDISKLNLDTTASLQQQKQEESRRTTRSSAKAAASVQEPIAAPQPTRIAPAAGMWNPDMGIKFGNDPDGKSSKSTTTSNKKGWDPNAAIKFGK